MISMNSYQDQISQAHKLIMSAAIDEQDLRTANSSEYKQQRICKILDQLAIQQTDLRNRINAEYSSFGPLTTLMEDPQITEIIVNDLHSIWYEKNGGLFPHNDYFFSAVTYRNILAEFCNLAHIVVNKENPVADGSFQNFRICVVDQELTKGVPQYTLRKHPENPWNFGKLQENNWTTPQGLKSILDIVHNRKNFLIVGSTGSGKTSVINACMAELTDAQRVVVIEDTMELKLPNSVSSRLVARKDNQKVLREITQTDLLKAALRLRPDRIIMGEIRGEEAKDFLMALATGHEGSLGSIHADNAHQALIRLEMLIQMAAPQWSLSAIRRLIQLSLGYIVTVSKNSSGTRCLKSIHKIQSLEETGFLLDEIYS